MAAQTIEALPESGAHQQATSANTATPASIPVPKSPNTAPRYTVVYLSARTNNAYVTFDGTVPTAANGIEIPVGQVVKVSICSVNDIRFCSAGAAAASILNALFGN